MELRVLKNKIENRSVDNSLIIFSYTDTDFIAKQYIKEISNILRKDILYLDNIDEFVRPSMFFSDNGYLNVYECDELKEEPRVTQNIIIITKKCQLSPFVIEIPKLEQWQIKDYAYSICDGVDEKVLDDLVASCKKDIYKLDMELSKIKIFNKNERNIVTRNLYKDFQLPMNITETIFDFTNAILKHDYKMVDYIYTNMSNIDIEPLGVITVLYNNLKKMIMVGLMKNPTEQSTGLPSKQIYAIKKTLEGMSADFVLNAFKLVSEIDYKLKNGDLPANMLLDYCVLKMLSI